MLNCIQNRVHSDQGKPLAWLPVQALARQAMDGAAQPHIARWAVSCRKQVQRAVSRARWVGTSVDNFAPVFNKQLEGIFLERMDGNEEIFVRLMNDDAFRNVAASHLIKAVYEQVKKSAKS